MTSLVLATATRYMLPLLMLLSFFILIRGHNEPGGGFIGGLVVAGAFVLYAMAYDVRTSRKALRVDPRVIMAAGLLITLISGLIGIIDNRPLLSGLWSTQELPLLGKVGTPLLFDIGVYLVVMGVALTILFSLMESE